MAKTLPIRNAATGLRKAPRQARSGETFEAILAAAAHILASEGARRFTTNRVAKRAGVSIGSLYQYFPNKQAIARALVERELERAARTRPALLDDPAQPLAARMRAAVDWQLDSRGRDPVLARELRGLVEAALPAEQRKDLQELRTQRTRRTVASALDASRDAEQVAFVVEVSLDAIIEAAVARRPQWLESDAFRAEVARLLERYVGDES